MKWEQANSEWEEKCLALHNSKGRARTYEETSLMLLLLKSKLKCLVEAGLFEEISWTKMENEVAEELKVDAKHVREARKVFDEEGRCVIVSDTSRRGRGSDNYDKSIYQRIYQHHLAAMVVWVDKQHSKGETVTNQHLRNWFRQPN